LLGYAVNLKKLHGGIGFTYLHEEIGFSNFNKTKINYSYQIKTKTEGIWSFGIAAGFNNLKFEPEWIIPNPNDPALSQSFNETGFTGDFGIVYSAKKVNFAISATQLSSSRIGDYDETPHFILMTDYLFGKDDGLQLKPQIFVMTDLTNTSLDINAMIYWKQKLGAGITYRNSDDLGFTVNWDILKKFRIGYAYDLALGALANQSKGSHTGFFGLVFNEANDRVPKKK
jgi:type IX secretion system PorP/SprF family membrane protein